LHDATTSDGLLAAKTRSSGGATAPRSNSRAASQSVPSSLCPLGTRVGFLEKPGGGEHAPAGAEMPCAAGRLLGSTGEGRPSSPNASSRLLFFPHDGASLPALLADAAAFYARMDFIMP
jgi:hypothetical protein